MLQNMQEDLHNRTGLSNLTQRDEIFSKTHLPPLSFFFGEGGILAVNHQVYLECSSLLLRRTTLKLALSVTPHTRKKFRKNHSQKRGKMRLNQNVLILMVTLAALRKVAANAKAIEGEPR